MKERQSETHGGGGGGVGVCGEREGGEGGRSIEVACVTHFGSISRMIRECSQVSRN